MRQGDGVRTWEEKKEMLRFHSRQVLPFSITSAGSIRSVSLRSWYFEVSYLNGEVEKGCKIKSILTANFHATKS